MNIINFFYPKHLSRRIALGFLVAVVLIVLGFALSFYSYNKYREDSRLVKHTYEVINNLGNILSSIKDTENGIRGYIITQDSLFLEPYELARRALPGQLQSLRRLVSDNPPQYRLADTLLQLTNQKLFLIQRQTTALKDVSLASRVAYQRIGKVRMDQIRNIVARMIATEQQLVQQRTEQTVRTYRNTIIVVFLLSTLTFLTLAISYRLLRQELIRRQQNEDQLRAYEEKLKQQIRQLEASNEELERFAFVASHDLQEPLRKIQSFGDLLLGRHGHLFDGESRGFMHKITHSADRMSKLIKDLLNFSRVSNHQEQFGPIDLRQIVQRILDDQELRIKGLQAEVQVGPLPMIIGVSNQIEHLFMNLIANALKFTRPNVRPSLRIASVSIDGSRYAGLVTGRRYFEITITDNGIGFDEKYLAHIFKVFQRLHGKSEYDGTGIGLAICKRVIMYHHGHITARSQPGQGSTFVVVLPESQFPSHYHDRTNTAKAYSYSAG